MSNKRHHAEWLSLVEVSGPFLTLPVLEKVFPQGLDAHDAEHYRNLRLAFEEWEEQYHKPAFHRAWIKYVLAQTLGLPDEVLAEGQAIPEAIKATVAEHGETLRPDFIVRNPADIAPAHQPRLLIQTYSVEQDLNKPVAERHWKASPATRMMELLHSADVKLGLVTNGEHWMLVYAPRGETTGYASWYASLWLEEKLTLQAFRSLLGVQRFFNVPDVETLDAMLAESAKHQQEVTDQLGLQVRRAVEVLIQSLDRADQDHGRALLGRVPEAVLYEAALTVMMRLVFLFCAEERELLLLGDELYDRNYAVSTLVAQLQEAADQHGEEVLERRHDAWVRLLATFRAVFGGVEHERLRLPAYGGRLFDPDRFPFLEGRAAGARWRETAATPLPVNNRTVLHLLRSLQYLEMRGEARRLSFRALDIEQIGHVYEGLLDHTAKRAPEPVLGLVGPKGSEPEIPLKQLETARAKGDAALLQLLKDETGKSESALNRLLETPLETDALNRLRAACGNDEALFKRVRQFGGLVRDDTFDRPVVIPTGSVYVTAGTDRRSSGTHYTPRSLTEPIVQYTLEPLVYVGPAEGKPKEEWRLRAPRELLELKICDMACGSGAFLVQACRYLAERLVEAWEEVERQQPGAARITPEGAASTGALNETLIPSETNERMSYAQRIVAQRCLYGVDKNPLAVEMAKLSLWLLTLAKDKPFTFLDHAIRCGDSLVGIKDLDQLRYFSLKTEGEKQLRFSGSVTALVDEVIALRRKIEASPANNVADVEAQEALLREAEDQVARLRYAADLLIAVGFQDVGAKALEDLHGTMAMKANYYVENGTLAEFKEAVRQVLHGQPTFHWPLEFPEVFVERGGFDAFMGNPPFMGGQKITGSFGQSYRQYVVDHVASGKKGSADLSVFFMLRVVSLFKDTGTAGLILTSAIAEGDNREVGLDQLLELGVTIYRADSSKAWPGAASVTYSGLWLYSSNWSGAKVLNNQVEDGISAYLMPSGEGLQKPYRLKTNQGKSFIGHYVLGAGFLMEPEKAKELISKDPNNKTVLYPFLNGSELNATWNQAPVRWVINFKQWPLSRATAPAGYLGPVAEDYPDCLGIVRALVKPERDNNNRPRRREKWWLFGDFASGLEEALKQDKLLFCISMTAAKHIAFCRVERGILLSHMLAVLALDDWADFAVISSSLHDVWTRAYTSYNLALPRYIHTDCFLTYPFPQVSDDLSQRGEGYHSTRSGIMRVREEGLTDTYNRFHDPEETAADIQRLRELHKQMDEAVARAYGWTDLRLDHDFHETKQGVRFTISEAARREVLDRLLELNHRRYAEEVADGLHEKKSGRKPVAGSRKQSTSTTGGVKTQRTLFALDDQASLFGDDDDEPAPESASIRTSRNGPTRATNEPPAQRPVPVGELETNAVMAAFRQALRGRGLMTRDELLKEVSLALGYQRLRAETEEVLRNHLRAAIRRQIVGTDGAELVGPATNSMEDYSLEELREAFASVMRLGRRYEREEVTHAVAEHLGFSRVSETTRQALKSAFNSGIRQGMLGKEGDLIWREE